MTHDLAALVISCCANSGGGGAANRGGQDGGRGQEFQVQSHSFFHRSGTPVQRLATGDVGMFPLTFPLQTDVRFLFQSRNGP